MKISIPIEFEVTALEDEEPTDVEVRQAAELAAKNFLAFVEISGYSSDVAEVKVHVDGYGKCEVRMVQ